MSKIIEKSKRILIEIPQSHHARMEDLMGDRFDSMRSYFRYLVRKEIQTYGPLPKPIPRSATDSAQTSLTKPSARRPALGS